MPRDKPPHPAKGSMNNKIDAVIFDMDGTLSDRRR